MFLCEPCHKQNKSNCMCVFPSSRGKCERCGNSADCYDCQRYNFSEFTDAEIEARVAAALKGYCHCCGKPTEGKYCSPKCARGRT